MWNVYSLIKSGAINLQIRESLFEREIRLGEERYKKAANECMSKVSKEIKGLENSINELKVTLDEKQMLEIANKVYEHSMGVSMFLSTFFIFGGKVTNGTYDKTILLIQKSYEFFNKYSAPCFDIFADATRMRLDYLTESAKIYQPELIKGK